MIKTTLLGSALAVALSAAPAMAADFQALAHLQGAAPTPLTDVVLAATEGGVVCTADTSTVTAAAIGGCSQSPSGTSAAGGIDALPPGISVGFAALGVSLP